jgi:hypothetical protein
LLKQPLVQKRASISQDLKHVLIVKALVQKMAQSLILAQDVQDLALFVKHKTLSLVK